MSLFVTHFYTTQVTKFFNKKNFKVNFKSFKSDFSSDLDTIFELSLQARPLLSRICSTSQEKKCLAVIEYINQQYNRYKSKLHKCNLLS